MHDFFTVVYRGLPGLLTFIAVVFVLGWSIITESRLRYIVWTVYGLAVLTVMAYLMGIARALP